MMSVTINIYALYDTNKWFCVLTMIVTMTAMKWPMVNGKFDKKAVDMILVMDWWSDGGMSQFG